MGALTVGIEKLILDETEESEEPELVTED